MVEVQSALTDFETRRKAVFEMTETALVARQSYVFKGRCHNCSQKGHTARYCPNPPVDDSGDEQQKQQQNQQQQKRVIWNNA